MLPSYVVGAWLLMVPSPRVAWLARPPPGRGEASVRVGFVTVTTRVPRSPDMFGIQISTADTGHTIKSQPRISCSAISPHNPISPLGSEDRGRERTDFNFSSYVISCLVEASDLSGIDRRGPPISKRVDARRQRERGRRKDETRVGRAPAPPLRQPNLVNQINQSLPEYCY